MILSIPNAGSITWGVKYSPDTTDSWRTLVTISSSISTVVPSASDSVKGSLSGKSFSSDNAFETSEALSLKAGPITAPSGLRTSRLSFTGVSKLLHPFNRPDLEFFSCDSKS